MENFQRQFYTKLRTFQFSNSLIYSVYFTLSFIDLLGHFHSILHHTYLSIFIPDTRKHAQMRENKAICRLHAKFK